MLLAIQYLANDSPLGDPTALIQFGVLGVILMLVLFGFLWAKPSVDRIITDKTKAEEARDSLIEINQREVIPVLADVKDKMLPGLSKLHEGQAANAESQRLMMQQLNHIQQQLNNMQGHQQGSGTPQQPPWGQQPGGGQ